MVGIPLRFVPVDPDMRRNTASEIGVARNRFCPQQFLQLEGQGIYRPIRAVEYSDLQCVIVVGMAAGDELDPHPQVGSQRSHTGAARKAGILKGLPLAEQLTQFLLKKVHRASPLVFGFFLGGSMGGAAGSSRYS